MHISLCYPSISPSGISSRLLWPDSLRHTKLNALALPITIGGVRRHHGGSCRVEPLLLPALYERPNGGSIWHDCLDGAEACARGLSTARPTTHRLPPEALVAELARARLAARLICPFRGLCNQAPCRRRLMRPSCPTVHHHRRSASVPSTQLFGPATVRD